MIKTQLENIIRVNSGVVKSAREMFERKIDSIGLTKRIIPIDDEYNCRQMKAICIDFSDNNSLSKIISESFKTLDNEIYEGSYNTIILKSPPVQCEYGYSVVIDTDSYQYIIRTFEDHNFPTNRHSIIICYELTNEKKPSIHEVISSIKSTKQNKQKSEMESKIFHKSSFIDKVKSFWKMK